jgi:predicted esterase
VVSLELEAWMERRVRPRPAIVAWGTLVGGLVLGAGAAECQSREGEGTTIVRRVPEADTSQAYALFLPPGHGTRRGWPAVFLLDPRGRAMVPLERFRDEARLRGYVLVSSYDSSSDEPGSGTDTGRAVEVLLNETLAPLSLDPARIYLAGFSGTARIAWSLAVQNPEVIAGVAGFGAGISAFVDMVAREVVQGPAVGAYFGGAGRDDFNYLETRDTESRLRDGDGFSWVRYYPGPHAWPPGEVAASALEWFDLHARRAGRLQRDPPGSAARVAALEAEAAGLDRQGHPYEAWRLYDYVVTGFEDLADVSTSARERERLARSREVRATLGDVERWTRWEREGQERVRNAVEALAAPTLPSADDLARRAGLADLSRHAASGDTLAAQAAGRQIALLMTLTTFYRFRELVAAGEHVRAVRGLELAARARPGSPAVCLRFRQIPEADRPSRTPLTRACAGDGTGRG